MWSRLTGHYQPTVGSQAWVLPAPGPVYTSYPAQALALALPVPSLPSVGTRGGVVIYSAQARASSHYQAALSLPTHSGAAVRTLCFLTPSTTRLEVVGFAPSFYRCVELRRVHFVKILLYIDSASPMWPTFTSLQGIFGGCAPLARPGLRCCGHWSAGLGWSLHSNGIFMLTQLSIEFQ